MGQQLQIHLPITQPFLMCHSIKSTFSIPAHTMLLSGLWFLNKWRTSVEWQFVNLPDRYATQKTIVCLMIEKLLLFVSEFPRHTSSRKHFKKTILSL